jgi:hypothetical protein
MGFDFSYKLYFKRDQLWNVLQGVVAIAVPHQPPARICFPDHVLSIPLDTWGPHQELRHDDPEILFAAVLNFNADKAILDYLESRGDKDTRHGPLNVEEENRVAIGMIYLTISQEISSQPASDLVLFDFGTPGTSMSLLFDESGSIRKTFLELLERYQGVCGVFNRETSGEVFWFKGQVLSETIIDDAFMLPGEIEVVLRAHR